MWQRKGQLSNTKPWITRCYEFSNEDFKVAILTMLQEIKANTLKMNRKIKKFCCKIEDFKKKEPNENNTMEKYNNQDKKIHQMATIIQLR